MKAKLLKKFEDEVAELERELHRELPKEIQRARELGDLRENAEYQAAKDRQGIVNARIAMLKKRIAEISIMNLDKIPHDRAALRIDGPATGRHRRFDYLSARHA